MFPQDPFGKSNQQNPFGNSNLPNPSGNSNPLDPFGNSIQPSPNGFHYQPYEFLARPITWSPNPLGNPLEQGNFGWEPFINNYTSIYQFPSSPIPSPYSYLTPPSNLLGIEQKQELSNPSKPESKTKLRDWWHSILRNEGKFHCYAMLIALSSDTDALTYLKDFGREIDHMTGVNCLFMALTSTEFKSEDFDDTEWKKAIDEQVQYGHVVRIADLFGIKYQQIPCLILFNDIRDPEYVAIELKGLTTSDISEKMRLAFSVIRDAIKENKKPLDALNENIVRQKSENIGKGILGQLKDLTKLSLETAVETLIKVSMEPSA